MLCLFGVHRKTSSTGMQSVIMRSEGFCAQTKKAHKSLQTNHDANKDHLYSHWLLVFPQGTELENHIFSDDAAHVKRGSLDLVGYYKYMDEKDEQQEVELYGMDVHWWIAVKGGEMICSPEPQKKKLFAQHKK